MYLSQIKEILRSPNTRFLALSYLTIWAGTAIVLGLMYWLIIQKIWADLETDLAIQTTEFRALLTQQSNTPIEEIINQMTQQPELYVVHPADSGHVHLSSLSQQDKNMSALLSLSKPPQHIRDHLHIMEEQNGAKLITDNIILTDGTVVEFSKRIDYIGTLEIQLLKVLTAGLVATFTIAMIISLFLARLSVKRITQYNKTFEKIIAGNMDRRVPVTKMNDEYDRLANTINNMLDRICTLVNSTRQVSDNIAHELRIPLARIRARLEHLNKSDSPPEIASSLNDLDRVLSMSDQLLKLAQTESATLANAKTINLHTLMSDLIDFYEPLAQEKNISLSYQGEDANIIGEADLLFQALSNLLDNAIKYTPLQGAINLTCSVNKRLCQIEISDSGPGVDEHELPLLFNRFHRTDHSRSKPGFGLGLSLVKVITTLHNGRIQASSENGLSIKLAFPCQVKKPTAQLA